MVWCVSLLLHNLNDYLDVNIHATTLMVNFPFKAELKQKQNTQLWVMHIARSLCETASTPRNCVGENIYYMIKGSRKWCASSHRSQKAKARCIWAKVYNIHTIYVLYVYKMQWKSIHNHNDLMPLRGGGTGSRDIFAPGRQTYFQWDI